MEDKKTKLKQKETLIKDNCIFSKDNVNVGHQPEFDYLKTLGVFLIILTHFEQSFSEGILFNIAMNISYTLKAGALMVLMGIGMRYSRHHEITNYFSRGFVLLTQGQYVNILRSTLPSIFAWWATGDKRYISSAMLILQADILSFSGIAFIFLGILKKIKLSDKCILIISIIMNFFACALYKIMKSPNDYLLSQFLGYFVLTNAEAYFPLCSYFIFVAFGYWLGDIYQKISNKDKFYNRILIFCLPISAIYYYFRIRYNFLNLPKLISIENYSLAPGPEAIATCIINLVVLALYYKLDKFLKKTPEFVRHCGKNLNQYYIISDIVTIQMKIFLLATRGDEFNIKYPTLLCFLLLIFCRILIDINNKYIHFTIFTLKNSKRNFVFILIWSITIICLIYVYPKVDRYTTMWNDYTFTE